VIDVHSHFIPSAYWSAVLARMAGDEAFARLAKANNLAPQPEDGPMRTIEGRIAEMTAAGVQISVLSPPPPGVAISPCDASLARRVNDELIEVAGRHSTRLRVMCTLPLPDVAASLLELDRVRASGLVRGVAVTTTATGWRLDDPAFDPLYRRLGELDFPLLAHPALESLPDVYSDFRLIAGLSPVISSSIGVLRMIYSGTLDRAPDLTVIVPHLGGLIPYLTQRLDDLAGLPDQPRPLVRYLSRRLILDTCSFHPPAFRCALETAGAPRLALGTDYPFRGSLHRAVHDVRDQQLGTADEAAVLGGNVARWFA
jgi:aminocarboxymuconate-semialdehyde decarboxylase